MGNLQLNKEKLSEQYEQCPADYIIELFSTPIKNEMLSDSDFYELIRKERVYSKFKKPLPELKKTKQASH